MDTTSILKQVAFEIERGDALWEQISFFVAAILLDGDIEIKYHITPQFRKDLQTGKIKFLYETGGFIQLVNYNDTPLTKEQRDEYKATS